MAAKPLSPMAQLRRDLLERVGARMAPYGVVSRIAEQTFRRSTAFGWWELHLAVIPYNPICMVHAHVSIRVDAVEKLVSADAAIPESDKKRSATVGAELGNIADGRTRPWYVQATDNLDEVADEIVRLFASFGLPYLQRLSDLEVMLDALSRNDSSAVLYSPFPSVRCQKAVALALVLGFNDRAATLAAECRSFLKRHDPGNAQMFEEFADRVMGSPRDQ